ncbi:unnamed protein product [Rotaria sp. Silwood2]|nr:unnamed protein product [Rotaria sp. Silwood2]CAF4146796.1 unnamed protein product [Rotaria sp. Silwood2]
MKDYSKVLNNFEKCLTIIQQALQESHLYQPITYSNIGDVHRLMCDPDTALIFHLIALNIQEIIQCNPLKCATTYTNLGETYREI